MDKRLAAANIKAGNIKFLATDSAFDKPVENSVMLEFPANTQEDNQYVVISTLDALGLKVGHLSALVNAIGTTNDPKEVYIYQNTEQMLDKFNQGRVRITPKDNFSNIREVTENLDRQAFSTPRYFVLSDKGIKMLHTSLLALGVSHPVIDAANEIILEKEGKGAPGVHSQRAARRSNSKAAEL